MIIFSGTLLKFSSISLYALVCVQIIVRALNTFLHRIAVAFKSGVPRAERHYVRLIQFRAFFFHRFSDILNEIRHFFFRFRKAKFSPFSTKILLIIPYFAIYINHLHSVRSFLKRRSRNNSDGKDRIYSTIRPTVDSRRAF